MMMTGRSSLIVGLLGVAVAGLCLALAACGRSNGTQSGGRYVERRIVTLSPAITQMIVDLDRADLLVGVAAHDMAAPEGLPAVSAGPEVNSINAEALLALEPTHVLTMVSNVGVPRQLQNLADMHNFELIAYPYPHRVEEVFLILSDDRDYAHKTRPDVATVVESYFAAGKLKFRSHARLLEIGRVVAGRTPPRVLMLIGLDPVPMASGEGTVHDDLLTSVGGMNVVETTGASAPTFDREKLLVAKPDVILLLMPGAEPLGSIAEDARLAIFRGLDIPAVKNERIVMINDPLALLPSTSIVRVGADMAKALHPDLAEQIEAVMASDPLEAEDDTAAPDDAEIDDAPGIEPLTTSDLLR